VNTSDIRARIIAVIMGVALLFFVAFVPTLWSESSSLILFFFDIVTYGVAGIVFGFIWPSSSWRLGLYLFAVWPPLLLFPVLLSGGKGIPFHWRAELLNLLRYFLILVGACVGAWLGAFIARRASNKTSTVGKTLF
jgi:hypothetical protein